MSVTASGERTVQVYRIYIRAGAQAIWDALTKPEWTQRYGYGGRSEYDLRPGGRFRSVADERMQAAGMPEVVVDGEVVDSDPPRRLVQTWRATWTGEPATRLTYEIEDQGGGVCSLTLTHDLTGAPETAAQTAGATPGAGGGWAQVISDLKTLLETGTPMAG